jgi:FkbM family methyltransferase
MAWIGLNARLLAIGVGNLCRHLVLKNGRVFLRTLDGILVAYDFKRRDGGLHPMYIYDFVYESRELEVIRRHLRSHSTFVDIGANIGMHSIRANEGEFWDCSVLAIEADQATFLSLEANVVANSKVEQIELHHAALWSSVTTIEWHGDQLEHGHNHASVAPLKTDGTMVSKTLDAILANVPDTRSISVIKLDVEGAELEVLKGAERTLRFKKPALVIEIDDAHLAKNGSNGDQIRSYLRSLGYQHEVPIVNALSRKADNFLFLP